MISELLSTQEQLRYEGFIKSLELIDIGIPTFIVMGADTHTLQDAIFEDIKKRISNYKLHENPRTNDEFRPIFLQKGELDNALKYYEAALKISTSSQNMGSQAVNTSSIGMIAKRKGETNKALKYYQEALGIFIGDLTGKAYQYRDIGRLYHLSNFVDALNYLTKALDIFKKTDNLMEEAITLHTIGILYRNQNDQNRALSYLKQALAIYEKIGVTDSPNAVTTREQIQAIQSKKE